MKVLLINVTNLSGSTGRNCSDIQKWINQNPKNQCIIAFAHGKKTNDCFRIGNVIEWKIHALMSRLLGKQAHFSKTGTRKLIQFINSFKPDVVNINNIHSNYINLAMLFKYLASRNIPTVLTLHDCWLFTGKCCHYSAVSCQKWIGGCHDCPKLRKDNPSLFFDQTPFLWNEKKTLFQSVPRLGVIGVSDWITGEAKKSFLKDAKIISRIYNWIDIKQFLRNEKQPNSTCLSLDNFQTKQIIIGVASSWGASKGLDKFFEVAEQLPNDFLILLIGALPPKIRLPNNIVGVNSVSSIDEMVYYYSISSVLLNLSLEESFGKVSAEALSCGTPIICIDSTANKELVGPGCGVVLPAYSCKAVIQAVKTVCSKPRGSYQRSCRTFAEENFEKNQQISKYFSFFIQLSKTAEIH